MLRTTLTAAALATVSLAPISTAQSPFTFPQVRVPADLDSGFLHNPSATAQVVFRKVVRFDATTWLQLEFGEAISLPAGSFLRMTSSLDGAVQRHDGRTIVDWQGWSAAFNGGEVVLELVAAPGSIGNRVVVDEVTRGLPGTPATESICGPTDDRALSSDPREGRLFVGCTGWMIGQDLMLTAGHCTASGSPVIEFNVPLSTTGGSVVRSHPDDQYPFTILNRLNGGVGADWSVQRVGPNSNHGQLPTQRNGGQWYTLGAVPSSPAGQNIRITGYGSTSSPVSPTWYLAQKTHLGTLSTIGGTSLCYATDTTGGNSGSPVIHENTGHAIGIHTHGGCSSTGGCNSGTRIDRGDLQQAITAAGQTPGRLNAFGVGCAGTGQGPASCLALNGTGGTLTNPSTTNEYAYAMTASTPLQVTGFSVYTAATTATNQTVGVSLYSNAGGTPSAAPIAQTTMVVGSTPGFYTATLPSTVTIPAGPFFVGVDHSGGTTYISNISSGTAGQAFWRRPALSGNWALSGIVTTPSLQVLCAGGGGAGAVPAISASGTPMIGGSYSIDVAFAAPSALAAAMTGFSNSSWNGTALPLSLTGLGAAGCSLLVAPNAVVGAAADPSGSATYGLSIPNTPGLIGTQLYHQWVVFDAAANALGVATSAGIDAFIGG
jgi:V8-like Glu-specific endopeptidase